MAEPTPGVLRVVRAIDAFTDRTGNLIAWLAVPLVIAIVWEVSARYLFNAPTIWAYDVTAMLYGALFMLGAAYALHKGAHVRTDFLWEKFSLRKKGLIDLIAYIVFFFPTLTVLLLVGGQEAVYSFAISETSEQTAWHPVLWPLKFCVPATMLLLLIQGVSELIKSWYMFRHEFVIEQKEKVEI